jgi:hypothetical protein
MIAAARTSARWILALVCSLLLAQAGIATSHGAIAGGPGGSPFSDNPPAAHARVAAVMVRSGSWIDSVQVLYQMPDGSRFESARHGGPGGGPGVFVLEPGERITAISGSHGQYVHSIRIHTDRRSSREYGVAAGAPFRIEVPPGRTMVGFVGRSGAYLDAIGLALAMERPRMDLGANGSPAAPPASNGSSAQPPQATAPRLLMPPRVESRVQEDRRYARATITVELSAPAAVELVVGDHDPGPSRCFSPGYRPVLRSPSPTPSTRHTLGMRNLPMATPYYYAIRIGAGRCESGRFTTATLID